MVSKSKNMEKINLALVGCGGMGIRHLSGLKQLELSGMNNVRLVGVCDLEQENALNAASEAEELLGVRPDVYSDLEAIFHQAKHIDAVDIVTEPSVHHILACIAFEAGAHVMVEKPMGITVKACQKMIDFAQKYNKKVSVAENYRRDPVNRLARSALDKELIGKPYLMIHNSLGGGNQIFITPWRHLKNKGGALLDMGVHYTDIIQYYLGEIDAVYGQADLIEKIRYREAETVQATSEDVSAALFTTKSGVAVQWILTLGGHHSGGYKRAVYGTKGELDAPGDRNGRALKLRLAGQDDVAGSDILQLLPAFHLDEITSRLFGENSVQYEMPFQEVDSKIIAIEYHDFASAILNDQQPEVDGILGMKAVAAIYGILESAVLGTSVKMSDIESGEICGYQEEIDRALRL